MRQKKYEGRVCILDLEEDGTDIYIYICLPISLKRTNEEEIKVNKRKEKFININ